ncbi:MAG: guanylate kinase [Peptococcaceae bacterium]|nr:guanylate kinase [Peptococcaceae bacterium]
MNSESGKGMLILISGPSGSGKGTVCKLLLDNNPDLNLTLSISATTRPPRAGEIDSRDYFFLSEKEFQTRIDKGDFLEWAPIYGYHYGTPLSNVLQLIEQGKNVILEIDVQGGVSVKKKFAGSVLIFLLTPSREILYKRLAERKTESQQEIDKRIMWADTELGYISSYDYVLINDNLEETVARVRSIIMAEQSRSSRFKLADCWKQ